MSFTAVIKKKDEDKAEDDYNAANASYVTAPPSGVLSVHIKSLKLDENHFLVPEPEVYIRVRVGSITKSSLVVYPQRGKYITVINDVKNFSLTISRDRSVPQNQVRIDLIIVMSAHVHRILGHKDMHIYDIIKNLYVAGNYDLRFRQQHVAYVDVEMCFAYGIFGFGYSHQLENRQANVVDIVSHSLLYRADPPVERRQSNSLVMAPVHLNHPEFMNFITKMKIGPAARQDTDIPTLDPFENLEKEEPVLLLKKMTKRLHQIQFDYSQLTDRIQRRKFLEKLILRKVEDQQSEPASGDLQGDSQTAGRHGSPGNNKGGNKGTTQNLPKSDFVTVNQNDDEYEEGEMNVFDMSSILSNAPGIVRRGFPVQDKRVSNLLSVSEDCESGGSVSTMEDSIASDEPGFTIDDRRHSRQQSTITEIPSVVLRTFSDRLRMWRDRGISVAAANNRVSVVVKSESEEETNVGSESIQYYRERSSLSRLSRRVGSHENVPLQEMVQAGRNVASDLPPHKD